MGYRVLNVIALQVGWFACVLGAAQGEALWGPLVVLGLVSLHLILVGDRRRDLRLLGVAALLGTALDTALGVLGLATFSTGWTVAWLSPLWMTALWINFATGLNTSLTFLRGRYALAAGMGAVGGPLAYLGGEHLGAIALSQPWGLVGVAVEWAVALPLLLWMNRALDGRHQKSVVFQEVLR